MERWAPGRLISGFGPGAPVGEERLRLPPPLFWLQADGGAGPPGNQLSFRRGLPGGFQREPFLSQLELLFQVWMWYRFLYSQVPGGMSCFPG